MSLIQSHEEQPVLNLYYLVEVPKAGVMLDTLNRSLSAFWDSFQELCKSNNICPHVHMYQYDTDCVEFFDSFEQRSVPPITPSSASKTLLSPALELLHKEMMQQYSIPCRKVPHFYPIVILMSCSHIQDDFEKQYHALWSYYWYANATKIGFAIGDSADLDTLVDMTGTAEAVISSTNLELFRRLLRFRCLADEDYDIEVLLEDIESFEAKYVPSRHPKACSRLHNAGTITIDLVNGTSLELLPGQEVVVTKGQVMPCASLEEFKREIFILSNDQGICRVKNVSGESLVAYIILNPKDSFVLHAHDYVSPLDDNPMSPFTIENAEDDFGIYEDAFELSIPTVLDRPEHKCYINYFPFGELEVKRCELGPCSPNVASETVFRVTEDGNKYRMTNVSSYAFSVTKEFMDGDFIVFESGGKIAEPENQWHWGHTQILMELSVSTPNNHSDPIVVPLFDDEDWGDW